MRRSMVVLVLMALVVGFIPILSAHGASTVGSFEIEGNLIDDSGAGEPIDWSTPPPNLTNFTDATGSGDNIFGNGSKELEPGNWSCVTGSAPSKDDITSGQIAFRTFGGKQFIYTNFTRYGVNGDAHIDYEFNQSKVANPSCPALVQRTNGDIVITFDTENGGKSIFVRAFRWTFTSGTSVGTFTQLSTGSKGVTFDGAVNIPNTIPGHTAGDFGEAALNLTDTIGSISCGQFASTYMKSRASTAINAALKDRTTARPANVGECPNSNLVKSVRNVTTNGTFGPTANASPGNTLEYRIVYTNDGNIPATGVVVTDAIQPNQTFVTGSCTPACTTNGPPVTQLTWNLGTQQPGASVTMTFRVTLASSFPVGTTHVKNVAVVDSNEEAPENSNETDVTVTASVNITSAKTISQQTANVGDKVTYTIRLSNSGNQAGTTTVTDNYDQAHLTISNISGGGVDNGDTIVWSNVVVPPGTNTVTLTYDATVHGPFSGGAGTGGCQPGQFPVINNVTLSNGGGSSATLCVNGQAVITSVKTVSPTVANEGDTVHYSIKLSNSGNITGTTTIVDDYDQAHITVSNISNGGVDNGDTITWTNVSVPVGSNTVTLTYDGFVKPGSFTGTPGGAPCTSTQFKVRNNLTLSTGGGSGADLCVNGHANITVVKTADKSTAAAGDQVHYTITLSNSGNIAGTASPVDDYDQAHVTVSAITGGGVDNGNTITWTNVSVPAGGTTVLTYTGTIHGPFSGGNGTCQPGQFPVINLVTITGDDSTVTVCVTAPPDLHLVKSADQTAITPGGSITYTLAYSNTGSGEATNVVITETVPAGTTYASCTGGCTTNGPPVTTVTWNIGTVPAGGTGSVTMTVTVNNTAGCQVCNTATIASPKQNSGTAISSNQLCVGNTPQPNPGGATAGGNATGALVQSSLLGLNLTIPGGNDGANDVTSVDSFQSGVGSNSENNQLLAVDVPPPSGSVLHADVLRTETVGTVTATPAEATGASVGSAANVKILDGVIPGVPAVVSATLVRGYANAVATGTSSSVSSIGSAIEGLNVLGVPQAVFPGARVDLPAAIFGTGSYVSIYEEIKNTQTPSGTSGGTYGGDITVNMIRVHVTNMLVVGQAEVVVGHARAVATFPQTQLCGPQANQSVSGHAFMARVLTDPSILPVIVGAVEIPTNGGAAENSVNQISVDPLVISKAATTTTTGSFTPINTTASSYAEAKSVCVLKSGNACTIAAQLVRAQANSTATSVSRSSNSNGTDFVGLKIGGVVISLPIAPNTVITLPGIGFVILNEQFCDNGGTLATSCANGTVPGHTGLTVRAIHVILLDPAAGGTPGVDIIVAEAHSDARFV